MQVGEKAIMDEDIEGGFAQKNIPFQAINCACWGPRACCEVFARINVSRLVFSALAIRAGARCGVIGTPVR